MSTEKYITFEELPPQGKTKRFFVKDKEGKTFALIKWYGGWRKYVLFIEGDRMVDQNVLYALASRLEKLNRHHKQLNMKHGNVTKVHK